jgi:hypothetical protein
MDVLAAYWEVGTYRGAAVICGTTHKTVKRIVERHNGGGAAPERKERIHNYNDVREMVAKEVDRTHEKISAKRLLPAAKAAGYEGLARNFRRLVALEELAGQLRSEKPVAPAILKEQTTRLLAGMVTLLTQHNVNERGQCQICI